LPSGFERGAALGWPRDRLEKGVVAALPLLQYFIMEQWIFKRSSAGAR
jgi:hypothetical protein